MNPWSFFFIGYVFFTAPHIFLIILLLTRSVCITDYLKISNRFHPFTLSYKTKKEACKYKLLSCR